MTRTVPVPMQADIDVGSKRLAFGLKITRLDGTVHAYTNATRDKTIDGVLYRSAPGLDLTSFRSTAGLAVGNNVLTALAGLESGFEKLDVLAQRWDGAAYELFQFKWDDPDGGRLVFSRGTLGNVVPRLKSFLAELRDLRQRLQLDTTAVFQETCRYRLGDERCTVNLSPWTVAFEVTSANANNQDFQSDDLTEFENDHFGYGLVRWITGLNEGLEHKVRESAADGTIVLETPLVYPIAPGDTGEAVAGCRKRLLEDCRDKFDNVLNYGAEPQKPRADEAATPPTDGPLGTPPPPPPSPAPAPTPSPAPPPPPPAGANSPGRPSNGSGTLGQTYQRTDRGDATNGYWHYTHDGTEWVLDFVPMSGPPSAFGADYAFGLTPYQPFNNQRGDLQTNGRSNTLSNALSRVALDPSLGYGADGAPNLLYVNDAAGGGRKLVRYRVQQNDLPTASLGPDGTRRSTVRRTMMRWVRDVIGSPPITLALGVTHTVILSLKFSSTLRSYYASNTGDLGGILWQIHGSNALSPNIGLYVEGRSGNAGGILSGSTNPKFYWRLIGNVNGQASTDRATDVITPLAGIDNWAADVRHKFVLRFRFGWGTAPGNNQRTEIWYQAGSGGSITKIADSTAWNSRKHTDANPDYAGAGIYKYRAEAPSWQVSGAVHSYDWGECLFADPNITVGSDDVTDLMRYMDWR